MITPFSLPGSLKEAFDIVNTALQSSSAKKLLKRTLNVLKPIGVLNEQLQEAGISIMRGLRLMYLLYEDLQVHPSLSVGARDRVRQR